MVLNQRSKGAMIAIKHILFPIDFSDQCCAAVPFVNTLAARFGSRVTLINALPPVIYGAMSDPYAGVAPVNIDEILEDLRTRLGSSLVKELGHVPVDRVVELGEPAQVITDFAH